MSEHGLGIDTDEVGDDNAFPATMAIINAIKGRVRCYGKIVDDPKGVAALEQSLEQKDDLIAGRERRTNTEGLTIADLANQFLSHKQQRRGAGCGRPFERTVNGD